MGGVGKEAGGGHRKEAYSPWPSRTLSIIRLSPIELSQHTQKTMCPFKALRMSMPRATAGFIMGLVNLSEAWSDLPWEFNILLSWLILAIRSINSGLSCEFMAEFLLR